MFQGIGSIRSRRPAIASMLLHSSPILRLRIAVAFCALAMLACRAFEMAFAQLKAATTTALAVTSGGTAVTTVSYESTVALTANVNAGTAPVSPGQVNLCDASAAHCTNVHILGTAQLTSAATAVFKFHPGAGSHSYKAVFLGTDTLAGGSSNVLPLMVTSSTHTTSPTTTTIARSGSIGNYSLTATIIGTGSSTPLTGNVSFLDTSYASAVLASAAVGTSTPGAAWKNSYTASLPLALHTSVVTGDFNGDGWPDVYTGRQHLQFGDL